MTPEPSLAVATWKTGLDGQNAVFTKPRLSRYPLAFNLVHADEFPRGVEELGLQTSSTRRLGGQTTSSQCSICLRS